MISSRSMMRVFGDKKLSEVRVRLQAFLQAVRWYVAPPNDGAGLVGRNQGLFDIWIHENDPAEASDQSTLNISLREIQRADIVVVLYTGEAGSASGDSMIGICHAELQEALARRPEIVSMIHILPLKTGSAQRDVRYREYVDRQDIYRVEANTEEELKTRVVELLQQRVSVLAGRGATYGSRKRDRGAALDWNRLDLVERRNAMREALAQHLSAEDIRPGADADGLHLVTLPIGRLAMRLDAIAAAISVAAARESVGQPFLRDHAHVPALKKHDIPGIVHVIACHRGITEAQASRILGTPDVIGVSSDFGVYVADHVQKIQMVFLAQCADETATSLAVRRFMEWLSLPGRGVGLLENARSRRRILEAVAKEQAE